MIPYWLLFGGFACGALLDRAEARSRIGFLLWFASAVAVLMIGLRYRVGGDWGLYLRMFRQVAHVDVGSALELPNSDPGYSVLNWLTAQAGLDIWFVNLICGTILIWGIVKIANRQPNPWLVFVIAVPYLIIVVGMGYTRQAVAIGISLVAITAFLDGNVRNFFIGIIVATLFHKSAIILLPVIGLTTSRNRLLTAAFVALLAALLYYFFVSASIDAVARNYLQAQLESEGATVRIAMIALPAALFLMGQRRFAFAEHERKVWRNMSLTAVACVVGLMVLQSSTIIDRLALYLIVLQLVILSRLPGAYGRDAGGRIILTMLVIAYSAVIQFVWLNYAIHASWWVPYRVYPLF